MWWIERQFRLAYLKRNLIGKSIAKFTGEGCQAMNKFQWLGKVIGFKKEDDMECVVIEILVHDCSYGDARDSKEPEIYSYPIATEFQIINDIQEVKGIWVLFAN